MAVLQGVETLVKVLPRCHGTSRSLIAYLPETRRTFSLRFAPSRLLGAWRSKRRISYSRIAAAFLSNVKHRKFAVEDETVRDFHFLSRHRVFNNKQTNKNTFTDYAPPTLAVYLYPLGYSERFSTVLPFYFYSSCTLSFFAVPTALAHLRGPTNC